MRKKELENLLFKAVADAIGVEIDPAPEARSATSVVRTSRSDRHETQRVAA